ncbi:MAG: DUF255 domain-containing protein [Saprospiraceae bacterium]
MRNLVLIIFAQLILVSAVLAQRTSSDTPASKSSATTVKPKITTPPPKSIERNSATNRSGGNTSSNTTSGTVHQKTSLRPSPTSLRNSGGTNARTSYSNQQATAKGVNRRVPAIKMVEKATVHWMSLEEALEKCKTENRKIFVDVYTDWCGWCKHMDSTTFSNPAVANYLNDNYYPVKLNAEQTEDIQFKDKVYHFKKSGRRGYHELAGFWLNNRLSFPTVVFLDENQNLIQPVPGYQDATKMEAIINYFGSDSHRKTPWETYEKNFSGN